MAFPRVGQSAPPTPHGSRGERNLERLSFTPGHRRSQAFSASSSASGGGSEYYSASVSPTSTTSSVSRVDLAVSRINSLSSQYERELELQSRPQSPALRSSTASNTISTGRTPIAPTATMKRASFSPVAARFHFDEPESPISAPRIRPTHRVTRSMGAFPVDVNSPAEGVLSPRSPVVGVRKPQLPSNPAHWTPSELAQHLAYTLRTGGPDGEDPTLPPPVIEDVISWVLRSRITGAQFLRGIDAHRGGRPPPFLPVLSALSRRMRRTIRHRRNSSAFSEADVFDDSDDSDGVTRVKRLAHAFDAISSCSEASESDGHSLSVLCAQITGDSITGYGRVTPKTESRVWTRNRRDSSISAVSGISAADSALSGISAASAPLWRMGADSDASSSVAGAEAVASWAQACSIPLDIEVPDSPTALRSKTREAITELAQVKGEESDASTNAHNGSPPPPYHTDDVPNPAALLFPSAEDTAPGTPDDTSRSASLTPLVSSPPADEPHLLRMVAHKSSGIDPYRVLRRGSGRPQMPLVSVDDEGSPHWATNSTSARRASRRAAAEAVKSPKSRAVSLAIAGKPRERDVSREVAALTKRIRELEERLVAVETPPLDDEDAELCADEEQAVVDEGDTAAAEPVCPTCSKPNTAGFPTPSRLNRSTSTRLSSSTSSRVSSRAGSKLNTSTRSALSMSTMSAKSNASISVADADLSEVTALVPVNPDQTLDLDRVHEIEIETSNSDAAVPANRARVSWLSLLGLVDECGQEPQYRDLPVYLFLMGVGVGIGFSAVVVKVVLGKKPV